LRVWFCCVVLLCAVWSGCSCSQQDAACSSDSDCAISGNLCVQGQCRDSEGDTSSGEKLIESNDEPHIDASEEKEQIPEVSLETLSERVQEDPFEEGTSEASPEESDAPRSCKIGESRPCYTQGRKEDVGRCRAGKQQCISEGVWGTCTGEVLPEKEACNGIDDDCDGRVDNGFHLCVSTIAGTGAAGYLNNDAKKALLNRPSGVAMDKEGNIFVADTKNHVIRKIGKDGRVSTFAGTGKSGFLDGPKEKALFSHPGGLVFGADGTLYVADTTNHRIRKIDKKGLVTTLAGRYLGHRDGQGDQARLYFPSGLTLDLAGNLYVADTYNHCIRKIDAKGKVTTFAGTGTRGSNLGTFATSQFYWPFGLVYYAPSDVIFVIDSANNRIVKLDMKSKKVEHVAGVGRRGWRDGTAQEALFYYPPGIAVDKHGNLFVADSSNNRIRKVDTKGNVTTVVGNSKQGYVDGIGSIAFFDSPNSVAVDIHGDLIVTDFGNHVIRKITFKKE